MAETKITKGQMFRVTVVADTRHLKAMGECKELANDGFMAGTRWWHDGILPRHFKPEAHFRYGYADRAWSYVKQKGGKPDMVLSGSMRDDLTTRATYQQSSNGVKLRMFARVLNLVPNIPDNSDELKIRHRGNKRFPNLKREVKVVNKDEREIISTVVAATIEAGLTPEGQLTSYYKYNVGPRDGF